KFRELKSLYHLVNQSWLTADKDYINAKMLELIRERQKLAWQRFAEQIDTFSDYITGNYPESLYIFTSDHGDNFGDEGWKYHFSNVTEAGNRVPLFMSGAGFAKQKSVDTPVSIRFINDTIRDAASDGTNTESIYGKEHFSPVLESFWYNRKGKTLPKYRHDQFAFIADKHRYVKNGDGWHVFELGNGDSANVEEIPYHSNPIYDVSLPKEQRDDLIKNFDEFISFSNSLEN
ncbi:MAG: sulfatase-like hydrolase/transferase, partial [Candidatus Marinimicrobia bacterium]|nr:sulfatase-like hydrolase/transferase [Candidatus Neomarinimicrobiota bacterium]